MIKLCFIWSVSSESYRRSTLTFTLAFGETEFAHVPGCVPLVGGTSASSYIIFSNSSEISDT